MARTIVPPLDEEFGSANAEAEHNRTAVPTNPIVCFIPPCLSSA
jgi:hypothetical protein